MNLKQIAKAKRNTLQIYATLDKYDMYRRTIAITPTLYEHDLLFYNDSIEERHERNKLQINKIIKAVRQNKLIPEMIEYNTSNTFYPSYVLNHHFNHFVKFVKGLSDFHQPLSFLLPKLQQGSVIGAIFDRLINVEFKNQVKVELVGGVIKMPKDSYFYSFKTSPYLHLCCFEHKQNNKNLYIFVQIRNENSEFCDGVQIRDLGATLSPDYLSVAYRFNNVKPLFIIQANTGKIYRNVVSFDSVVQLGYSLQDLANSLYVTVKYTSMRLQFATLEKSKAERPIVQYQAVTSRIADGFATLFGLSFLRQRLVNMPQVSAFMRFYLPFMHQVILQRLIDLRECCGGFGYLQVSGHPGFLQRTSIRAAQPALTVVPENKEIMKRVHYYSSDDQREAAYMKQVSEKGNKVNDIFYYFIVICIRMRLNRDKMSSRDYMKQFLRQSCIQMYYNSTYFDSVDPTNPTQDLLPYIITKYVIQHSKFLNWSLMKMEPQKFHEMLINKKTELLQKISPVIPKLTEILEIGYLRNIIVGQENSENFYRKVMEASEKNKRNSKEYKDYILQNLVSVIKEQRASL